MALAARGGKCYRVAQEIVKARGPVAAMAALRPVAAACRPFSPVPIPPSLAPMAKDLSYHDALAALAWQVELGADEAILDHPVDRFDLPAPVAGPAPAVSPVSARLAAPVAAAPITSAAPVRPAEPDIDSVAIARQLAQSAGSLETLRAAMEGFEHCELKRAARRFVFSDGHPGARVMVIGEAPGREEDARGTPFVGAAGQLLDKMFAAIGLDRSVAGANGLYITTMLPWRPPQDRDPKPGELAMMRPFVHRHIELAAPDVLVLMGNHACAGLLGRHGIARMRGQWEAVQGIAAMPMVPPAKVLQAPLAKREAWSDLLAIRARLEGADLK